MRTTKVQMNMGIHAVWSESSLCTQWLAKDPRFLHADSEDSDETRQMPRPIWVFAGSTAILLRLTCLKFPSTLCLVGFVVLIWSFYAASCLVLCYPSCSHLLSNLITSLEEERAGLFACCCAVCSFYVWSCGLVWWCVILAFPRLYNYQFLIVLTFG